MKRFLLIFLFSVGCVNAQNLKIEYERINKNSAGMFKDISDKEFKAKIKDQFDQPEKLILYFLEGNTFFKNLSMPSVDYIGKSDRVDANTIKRKTGSYTKDDIKMYHIKGDKGLYQYKKYGDDEFYHYAVPNFDKIEYKEDTDLIEKYKCKLVEVTIKGNLFKVWYTEDVPVSAGPYMFYSFPGLVLKIDSSSYIVYATKISNEGKKSEFEILDPKLKILNDAEFNKQRNEFLEDAKKVKEVREEIHL